MENKVANYDRASRGIGAAIAKTSFLGATVIVNYAGSEKKSRNSSKRN